jgi:hypothetical protein
LIQSERGIVQKTPLTKKIEHTVYSKLSMLMNGKSCKDNQSFGCDDETMVTVEYRILEMYAL